MAPPCVPLSKVTASSSDIRSTIVYLHADMTLKERALALTTPASIPPGRYRPTYSLLVGVAGSVRITV